MIKLLFTAGLAVVVSACAAPSSVDGADPMHQSRVSSPAGKSKAAVLGFHGPVYRNGLVDAPN